MRQLDTPNGCVMDLIHLLLLIRSGKLAKEQIAKGENAPFEHRRTHPLRSTLVEPPAGWGKQFSGLATQCEVRQDMHAAYEIVETFFRLTAAKRQK